MTTVYYSVACGPSAVHERQWARSVRSLRAHNRSVEVVLFLYGQARAETLAAARQAGVHVEQMGAYADAFGDLPAHWRAALSTFPVLHKLMSLRQLAAAARGPLIYLDCDTYLFGDVADLLARHRDCHWYAREEPNSRRSRHGYDASYVDETLLAALAAAEGLVAVPPYNTGVFVASRELAVTLAALVEDFLWYAWRLLLGACLWRADLVGDPRLVAFVRAQAAAREHALALSYPSGNFWILEQVATWLTLGRVPGLTHDVLGRSDVVQNGEFASSSGYLLAHYYSLAEQAFCAHLRAIGGQP